MKFKSIGVCQRRLQEGKPTFFVNYEEDRENKYFFSSIRSSVESFKNLVIKYERLQDEN